MIKKINTKDEKIHSDIEFDSSDEESEFIKGASEPEVSEPILKIHDDTKKKPKTVSDSSDTKKEVSNSSIVYIGRIPHGFYEDQMRGYFSQFGKIINLRLSRNKKTGRSKHYAFIEFESPEVATIVVETMNNYLLFGRLLQCKIKTIPSGDAGEEFRKSLWKGSNKKYMALNTVYLNAKKFNAVKSSEQKAKNAKRLVDREKKLKAKLEALGIQYDFPSFEKDAKKSMKKAKKQA